LLFGIAKKTDSINNTNKSRYNFSPIEKMNFSIKGQIQALLLLLIYLKKKEFDQTCILEKLLENASDRLIHLMR